MKFWITLASLGILTLNIINAQPGLSGQILIDTSIWRPVVYISIIPDFDKMYTMSNNMIIDEAAIDGSGRFSFNTKYFPAEDNLFRIHISKKSDPPATLNIGGKDENHFFLVASKFSDIDVKDISNREFIKDVVVTGYYPNIIVGEINEIASFLDSTALNGSEVKNDLIKRAVFERLRIIADTCSNPIASLYAIYKGDIDKNYSVNQQFYRNFLLKWKKEDSAYFVALRKRIPSKPGWSGINLVIGITSFLTGFIICMGILKFRIGRKKNIIQDLSLQERKIYALVLEGKSNKEIAEVLGIELSTVKSHLSSIYSKLNISSRREILNLNPEN